MGIFGKAATKPKDKDTLGDFTVKDIDGNDFDLKKLAGKVVLVVNVASKCRLTEGNYDGFRDLAIKFPDLVILGFPCNQFFSQEPATCQDIKKFANGKGFAGQLMDKVDVNGKNTIDLYDFLKVQSGHTGTIKWNFTKFVVARDGKTVSRFGSNTKLVPDMVPTIQQYLAEPVPASACAEPVSVSTCESGCCSGS